MATQLQIESKAPSGRSFTPTPTGLLQRKCACGSHTMADGECEECKKKQLFQRKATDRNEASVVPPIAHEVLRTPGQPLDPSTRAFFEPCFGHDFSQVRVHTDAKAADSARAVNALAYTVGRDVVFGLGMYKPETALGKQLLTHELTHVLQQNGASHFATSAASTAEMEAEQNAQQILTSNLNPVQTRIHTMTLQRQPSTRSQTSLDQTAINIIAIAQNSQRDLGLRAVEVIYRIISAYYPSDASIVSGVGFEAGLRGLETVLSGSSTSTRAIIKVGRYFVDNTDQVHFARRVLQAGHEINHIKDWRTGMAGPGRSDEREFRAFYQAATAQERPHTGRMQHIDRVSQIDAALGYYHCLSQALQQQYANEYQDLLARRPIEIRRSGHSVGSPPASCVKVSN